MTDGTARMLYSVDSSSFMDWQARYYPTDVFPTILNQVDALIGEERLWAPALVKEETRYCWNGGPDRMGQSSCLDLRSYRRIIGGGAIYPE